MEKLQSLLFASRVLITATTVCSSLLGGVHARAETLITDAAHVGSVTVPIQHKHPQIADQAAIELVPPNAGASTQAADLTTRPLQQVGQTPPSESQPRQPEAPTSAPESASNSLSGRFWICL